MAHRSSTDLDDPVVRLLKTLFISLADFDAAVVLLNNLGKEIGVCIDTEVLRAFSSLLCAAHNSQQGVSYGDFQLTCAISSIRKAMLSAVFHNTRVRDQVEALCYADRPLETAELIEQYEQAGNWIFATDSSEPIWILRLADIDIYFECGYFLLRTKRQDSEIRTNSFADVMDYVQSLNSRALDLLGLKLANHTCCC